MREAVATEEMRSVILRALVLNGPSSADDIGRRVRAGLEPIRRELDAMSGAGVVAWSAAGLCYPTAIGKVMCARLLALECSAYASGMLAAIDRELRGLDRTVSDIDLRWLLREDLRGTITVDDRSDSDYDRAIIADLLVSGARMLEAMIAATDVLGRYRGYHERLSEALERVERGDRSFVGRSSGDGCVAIWTEFRRDIAYAAFRTGVVADEAV